MFLKKNIFILSILLFSIFKINSIFKNEISIENDSEFKRNEIDFSNSKEDKFKLAKYVDFMVEKILIENTFLNDKDKVEIFNFIKVKIIDQCISILDDGYNLKLSKYSWRTSGFTFSAFLKNSAAPSESSDQKSEIKFYFNNYFNNLNFKIEGYEDIIAEKYLTNNNDISGMTQNKYIYSLKKPINKYVVNELKYGFKNMGFDLAIILNAFKKLNLNLPLLYQKKDGSFGDEIIKEEYQGFNVETKRSLCKSPWNNLAAKVSIEIKKK